MKNNQADINWSEAVLTNIIDAIIAIDHKGIIRYTNPVARKLLNLSTSNITNKPASDILKFIDSNNNTNITIPDIESFSNNSNPVILTRAIFITPNKKQITVNAVFCPIKLDSTTITGIVLRFRDVTAITLQEKKLWDKQKIKAIGSMASGIANDFISWLDIISSHASAVADNVIPLTRAYEEANNIISTAKQAKGMTRRLISISRLATDHYNQHQEAVNLNAAIKAAIKQSKLNLNSNIEFKPQYSHTEISVFMNELILIDCLLNIFRNAADAMPDGGNITIDIKKSYNSNYKNHTVLRIRDFGSGMNKETLTQSCEPFFSTKEKNVGMGLGLTIVKTFTQNYGGDIKIQSKEGIGTSVRLFLPLNNKITTSANKNRVNKTATILVAENNKETLNDIETLLKNMGNTVHTVTNTDDALKIYRQDPDKIDITIIDVVMPGKDGKYLFNAITKINPKASIIMMSGFSRNYIRDYIKNNKWWFIQKPINKEYLISTIEKILK